MHCHYFSSCRFKTTSEKNKQINFLIAGPQKFTNLCDMKIFHGHGNFLPITRSTFNVRSTACSDTVRLFKHWILKKNIVLLSATGRTHATRTPINERLTICNTSVLSAHHLKISAANLTLPIYNGPKQSLEGFHKISQV